jgi:hypothetical protein
MAQHPRKPRRGGTGTDPGAAWSATLTRLWFVSHAAESSTTLIWAPVFTAATWASINMTHRCGRENAGESFGGKVHGHRNTSIFICGFAP